MCVIYVFRTKQKSVEDYFLHPQGAAVLTESVLSMIVKDIRPLAMAEGKGFKEMLTNFQSAYTLHFRHHLTSMMERKYETSVETLRNKLQKATSKISLTTDAWPT